MIWPRCWWPAARGQTGFSWLMTIWSGPTPPRRTLQFQKSLQCSPIDLTPDPAKCSTWLGGEECKLHVVPANMPFLATECHELERGSIWRTRLGGHLVFGNASRPRPPAGTLIAFKLPFRCKTIADGTNQGKAANHHPRMCLTASGSSRRMPWLATSSSRPSKVKCSKRPANA